MKLILKTLIIFLILVISMIVVVDLVSNNLMTRELSKLERHEVISNAEKIELIFRSQISALELTNIDWAHWDDTYEFVRYNDRDYIRSNLQDDTFETLRLSSMIFLNSSNNIVYAKSYDGIEQKEIPVSNEVILLATKVKKLADAKGFTYIKGVIVLSSGPVLITSQEILKSNGEGPSRGMLIFMRYITDYDIDYLSKMNQNSVYILTKDNLSNEPNEDLVKNSLYVKKEPLVIPIDNDTISGYRIIEDIYGDPSIILRVDSDRNIYKIGQINIELILAIVIFISLIFVSAFFIFIHKEILSRLSILNNEINRITNSPGRSEKVYVDGSDEISSLANNVNIMIDSIDKSQKKLKDIIEHATNLFYSHTPDNVFTYVSPQAKDFFGIEPDEASIGWTTLLTDNPLNKHGLDLKIKAIETGERQPPYELELKDKNGKKIWIEIHEKPIVEDGKTVQIVGALVDITERKRALEQINQNIEYFAHLVDHIRNPLAILSGFIQVKVEDEPTSQRLLRQIDRIVDVIIKLDEGWMDTEDTRRFLNRK